MSDIAGLVERTKRRAAAKRMMAFTSQANELDELASALTALDERVKELEAERDKAVQVAAIRFNEVLHLEAENEHLRVALRAVLYDVAPEGATDWDADSSIAHAYAALASGKGPRELWAAHDLGRE